MATAVDASGAGGVPSTSAISSAIEEFYYTSDQKRREQIHNWLMEKGYSNWTRAFDLLDVRQPHCVQYFAACCLYDTVRKHWLEKLAPESEQCSALRQFLLETLTRNEHVQSVINKLSSTLALVALYSMPDLWPQPVADLTAFWAQQPELLIRVLTELAAEFPHVQLPLNQRALVKTELHRVCPDLIALISAVMTSPDSSASLRNAAVECVEQWLKVPGVELNEWKTVIGVVLGNVINDSAALSRLFLIVAAHDSIQLLDALTADVLDFIGAHLCPILGERIAELTTDDCGEDREESMEELESLVSAIVQFVEAVLRPVLLRFLRGETRVVSSFRRLCSELLSISTVSGEYARDESISDVTASFWTAMREELLSFGNETVAHEVRDTVIDEMKPIYVRLLQCAITKLTFPVQEVWIKWDLTAREKFDQYRVTLGETSTNAYFLIGTQVVSFLYETMAVAMHSGDLNRCESCLHLLGQTADYLGDADQPVISSLVRLSGRLCTLGAAANGGAGDADRNRMGGTMMRALYALSHLIMNSDDAVSIAPSAVATTLHYIGESNWSKTTVAEALKTLSKFLEERSAIFAERVTELDTVTRLAAMKCIGYALALRGRVDVMKNLDDLLAPRLQHLRAIADGSGGTPGRDSRPVSNEHIAFEIGVLSALIIGLQPLHTNVESSSGIASSSEPIAVIVKESVPLLLRLLKCRDFDGQLTDKVCEVLRSGLTALLEAAAPLLQLYYEVLSAVLLVRPAAAFAVVKNLLLVFATASSTAITTELRLYLRHWTAAVLESGSGDAIEPFIGFATQLIRKHCKFALEGNTEEARFVFDGVIRIAIGVLNESMEAPLVKLASQLLAAMSSRASESALIGELLQAHGGILVETIFNRLRLEILRSSVEALAETLFIFAKLYPSETRMCINAQLKGAESPLVSSMLGEVGNQRVFKQFAIKVNMIARNASR